MKKTIFKFSLLSIFVLSFISCGGKGPKGYEKTENGLYYKFEGDRNLNAPQPKLGDILVGEREVRLDDSVLISNTGKPERLFVVMENQFQGDINEGFLMMHLGDKVTFATPADSVAKHMQLPSYYIPNNNSYIYYKLHLTSIISKEEFDKEQQEYQNRLENAKNAEQDIINYYLTSNNIKTKLTASGLYITYLKKGNGAKVETGKTLKVNYTGKFFDGKVFDSNIEQEAKNGDIYNPQRSYTPMEYVNGNTSFIKGWDEAVSEMRGGDKIRVLVPSSMAYGERGSHPVIPPYSPLIFEIELISVK